MIQKVCTLGVGNFGSLGCTKSNPFVDAVSLLLTTSDFEFATFADFADEVKFQTAVKEKKIFPLHNIVEFEDQSEDAKYYESPGGIRIPRGEGKYRYLYLFNKTLEVHKAIRTLKNADLKVMVVDDAGNIYATSDNGVKVRGFSIQMINPEKMKAALQDNTPAWTPLALDFADAAELNDNGVVISASWNPKLLEPIAPVELSVITKTAALIVLKVAYYAGISPDGSDNLIGVAGIEEDDFVFTTTNPAGPMVDNGDGTYNFPGVGMVSGSVNLAPTKDMLSTGQPIESTGPVVITIP